MESSARAPARLRRLADHVAAHCVSAAEQQQELVQAWLLFANTIDPTGGLAMPRFDPSDVEGIAGCFQQTGVAIIDGALTAEEIGYLNTFIDETQQAGRWSAVGEYPQPLLDSDAVDEYVRHPRTFEAIEAALGGPGSSRFGQFEFRDIPAGAAPMQMGMHRDRPDSANLADPFSDAGVSGFGKSPADGTLHYEGEPLRRLDPELPPPPADYLCAVTYLTDVTAGTPAFCVVPHSFRSPITAESGRDGTKAAHEVAALMTQEAEAGGQGYAPTPVYGQAGTMILYDTATFHTRADPLDADGQHFDQKMWNEKPFSREHICHPNPSICP